MIDHHVHTRTHARRPEGQLLRLGALGCAILALASCSSPPTRTASSPGAQAEPPRIEPAREPDIFEQYAMDLEKALSEPAPTRSTTENASAVRPELTDPRARIAGPPEPRSTLADAARLDEPTHSAPIELAGSPEPPGTAGAETGARDDTPMDPEARIVELAAELSATLGDRAIAEPESMQNLARLLALEMIAPESAKMELDAIEEKLLPTQRETLDALRSLLHELASENDGTLDQRRLADLLTDHARELPDGRMLRVATVKLCDRVDGFGRYRTLPTQFVAGRSHPVLVYVEIENFDQRRWNNAVDGWSGLDEPAEQRWVVELGQEIQLLDAKNDHAAVHLPEQIVRDVARRERRDFFIVQRLTLPAALSIGKYHLKVSIRDKVQGDAVAEGGLQIEIVAPETANAVGSR